MSLLLETIKISDGTVQNIEYHNDRINRSIREIYGINSNIDLMKKINIPVDYVTGLVRCRIIYKETITAVEFNPYKRRKISNLKLVEDNEIYYNYKYINRSMFAHLLELNAGFDDILIIKNGNITDTSYSNIVFFDGSTWFTPDTPLLKGTKRQLLIDNNLIVEKEITLDSLSTFQSASLVNAMLEIGEVIIPIESIIL